MVKNIIITVSTILLLATNSLANDNTSNTLKKDTTASKDSTTQQIIDEFYAYAGTIKPEVREEIQEYRVEIVNINKKKRELYNSLSKEAQNFLTKEQEYKKKLPLSNLASEKDTKNDNKEHNTDNKK